MNKITCPNCKHKYDLVEHATPAPQNDSDPWSHKDTYHEKLKPDPRLAYCQNARCPDGGRFFKEDMYKFDKMLFCTKECADMVETENARTRVIDSRYY